MNPNADVGEPLCKWKKDIKQKIPINSINQVII